MRWISKIAVAGLMLCALPVLAQDDGRREVSIARAKALQKVGDWKVQRNVVVRGTVFDAAAVTTGDNKRRSVVFANRAGYDLLEATILRDVTRGDNAEDVSQFLVLGDGRQIYKSRRLSSDDAPVRISVPIKGYTGITLVVVSSSARPNTAIWGNLVFVKLGVAAPSDPTPEPTPPPADNYPDGDPGYTPPGGGTGSGIQVVLDGKPLVFRGTSPSRLGNRIVVPMRDIFEALGATVNWDNSTQSIAALRGQTAVQMQINRNFATVNGARVNLDQSPLLLGGSTMVPLRFVSEALGASVAWNELRQTVTINSRA